MYHRVLLKLSGEALSAGKDGILNDAFIREIGQALLECQALGAQISIVVGGGNIATRRVKTLLSFTRNIRVIAPKVTMEMMELGKAGYVELITRPVKRTDFAMAYMVIAATNDRKLNDEIHRICRQEGVYVNVASDREQCDFYFPGIYMEDGLVVGITASGLDHKKARRIREEIQNALERVAQEDDNEEENDD